MANKATKSKIKGALWSGFGFGLGAAVFVPLINWAISTARKTLKV